MDAWRCLTGGRQRTAGRLRECPAPHGWEPGGHRHIAFLDEVAETILPETGTPGAKAAGVGPFMALMVTDVYGPDDQAVFRDGMGRLDEVARGDHGVGFVQASPEVRLTVLQRRDRDQMAHEEATTEL